MYMFSGITTASLSLFTRPSSYNHRSHPQLQKNPQHAVVSDAALMLLIQIADWEIDCEQFVLGGDSSHP